jgi:hypothetical protein
MLLPNRGQGLSAYSSGAFVPVFHLRLHQDLVITR